MMPTTSVLWKCTHPNRNVLVLPHVISAVLVISNVVPAIQVVAVALLRMGCDV